ncbi:MAG: pyruvate formate lyase-activating protein [Ruminococcaceae bacterium]|nr:pyruvate formate lyase-activating protein [Oscillospiraceae bacterium]
MVGRIHSFQSLGTVDGPGVRFVVFMQGCPLRCGCCHNPDTWEFDAGEEFTALEVVEKIERYRDYFGSDGGVTVSGGEPLMQPAFVAELFSLCRERGIHTCLDTSGIGEYGEVLPFADRVLLDIKYTDPAQYRQYVGCEMETVLTFLDELETRRIPTTLRQVILPSLNDSAESLLALREIARAHSCVDNVELLPFRNICQVKYDQMGIPFPFAHLAVPTAQQMKQLEQILKKSEP